MRIPTQREAVEDVGLTDWLRPSRHKHAEVEQRIAEASEELEDLQVRGTVAAFSLKARHERNHWGETVTQIARGGQS
jgi:hypothetical protein